MNPLVDSNILKGERKLWYIGDLRYPAMEKVTLSGSLQTQPRLLNGASATSLCEIFELQTPDFAWKFVWTVPTNYEKKNLAKRGSRRPI